MESLDVKQVNTQVPRERRVLLRAMRSWVRTRQAFDQKAWTGFLVFLLLSPAPTLKCTSIHLQSLLVLTRSECDLVLMMLRAERAFHRTGATVLGCTLRGGGRES